MIVATVPGWSKAFVAFTTRSRCVLVTITQSGCGVSGLIVMVTTGAGCGKQGRAGCSVLPTGARPSGDEPGPGVVAAVLEAAGACGVCGKATGCHVWPASVVLYSSGSPRTPMLMEVVRSACVASSAFRAVGVPRTPVIGFSDQCIPPSALMRLTNPAGVCATTNQVRPVGVATSAGLGCVLAGDGAKSRLIELASRQVAPPSLVVSNPTLAAPPRQEVGCSH